jgi:hypothetical protein
MSILIYIIVILFILIVIGYFTYKQLNNNQKVEGFGNEINDNGQGNPLIKRNIKDGVVSSSITLKPVIPADSNDNILLNTGGNGWKPFNNDDNKSLIKNCYASIKLDRLHKISSIKTSGIKSFKLFYSKTDDSFSYEEVLYKTYEESPLADPSIIFESPYNTSTDICTFKNLTTTDGKPVYAAYLKMVPIETKTIISRFPTTGTIRDQVTIHEDGMKMEIMGYPNNAKPDFSQSSQSSKLTLIDDYSPGNVKNGHTWIWDPAKSTSPNSKQVKLSFGEPLTINSIIFQAASEEHFISKLTIKYKIEETGIEKSIDNIYLCTPYTVNNTDNTKTLKTDHTVPWTYFFNTPIVASELILKSIEGSDEPGITISEVNGQTMDNDAVDAYKQKSKNDYCSADSQTDDISNSAQELLSQQLEIQKLCDTMEMQDKIKENNQKIQKNRQYLMQLEEQDRKIAALEDVVEKMKHLRMIREKTSDTNMAAEKIKQENIESQLAKLIEDRNKNMKQLNVTLKLNDASLNQMNQTVENLENASGIGNNTSTTSLEGFTNPIKNKKEIPQYEYSQGFYYRPYADSTVQTQLVESHERPSPDLRQFGLAFNSEKVSPMKFYENKVMCTKGCDVNTQFVKMQ